METNIGKMYMNLNELLNDICKFLNSDKLRVLSPKDKKQADILINRCKVQLQEISKIQQQPPNDEYVDMNSKKDDNVQVVETTAMEEAIVSPYKDLPAKEASQEVKYGPISMRRKFLLGFEKMKKVYAAIHHQWLLVYCSDKDLKPIFTFDLKNYEAKADSDRSTNFEIISTTPDTKTYHFMAITPKDRRQWVVQINKCHNDVILQSNGLGVEDNSVNDEDDIREDYDFIITTSTFKPIPQEECEDEPEDIYIDIDKIVMDKPDITKSPPKLPEERCALKRPALPGRKLTPVSPPKINSPLPSKKESKDEDSIASYDVIEMHPDQTSQLQFSPPPLENSEDDEYGTYETFVDVHAAGNKFINNTSFISKFQVQVEPTDTGPVNLTGTGPDKDLTPIVKDVPVVPLKPKVKDRPPVTKKPVVEIQINNSKYW